MGGDAASPSGTAVSEASAPLAQRRMREVDAMLSDMSAAAAHRRRQEAAERAERRRRRSGAAAADKPEAKLVEAPAVKAARDALEAARKGVEEAARSRDKNKAAAAAAERNQDALRLMHTALAAQVAPLKTALDAHAYKVAGMRSLLDKHHETYGENAMWKMLRNELHEEGHKVDAEREAYRDLQPKEQAKRRQLTAAVAAAEWEQRRARRAEERLATARAALAECKAALTTERAAAAARAREAAAREREEARAAAERAQFGGGHGADEGTSSDGARASRRAGVSVSEGEEDRGEPVECSAAQAFAGAAAGIRRLALAAGAASPRWRQRLLDELAMLRAKAPAGTKARGRRAVREKDVGEQDGAGSPRHPPVAASSFFSAKVSLPLAVCERFKLFCQHPPNPPFAPCTSIEVQLETLEAQTLIVSFESEPAGNFRILILRFVSDCLTEQDIQVGHGDKIFVRSTATRELPTFQSRRERWAAEGLVHDTAADLRTASVAAHAPRPEESGAAGRAARPDTGEYLLERAARPEQRATHAEVVQIPVFAGAPVALQDRVVAAGEVLELPAQAKVVDQGSLGDSLFLLTHGALIEKRVNGTHAEPIGVLRPPATLGARCLVEPYAYESTFETLEPARLLRFRRDALHPHFSKFPGDSPRACCACRTAPAAPGRCLPAAPLPG